VAKISGGQLENEAIDGQPGPESRHVIVLELANCREKVSPVPAPFARRRWKTPDLGRTSWTTQNPIRLLKHREIGRRFPSPARRKLGHRGGVARIIGRADRMPEVAKHTARGF